MIIPVNETWRITSDSNSWKVEKHTGKDKQGNEVWHPRTFHINFSSARKCLAEMMIMSSEAEGVEAAIEEIMNTKSILENAFGSIELGEK